MKVFNVIFCIIFIIFAALQYNDPDPYVWMPIYLYAAVLCALAIKHRFSPVAYGIGIVIYSLYAAYLFFTRDGVFDWVRAHQAENIAQTMKATKPWIEQTREFFGLIITIVVLLVNYYLLKKHKKTISL